MTKMRNGNMLAVCLMLILAGLGCTPPAAAPTGTASKDAGKVSGAPKTEAKAKGDTHSHGSGPNGGVVFDLGAHHAEFTVDHPAKTCMVLFIDGEGKDAKPMSVAANELTLNTKESKTKDGKAVPPMTVTLKPVEAKDGKAAKFIGSDPGIANVADFAGTVLGEVDGKPANGEFEE